MELFKNIDFIIIKALLLLSMPSSRNEFLPSMKNFPLKIINCTVSSLWGLKTLPTHNKFIVFANKTLKSVVCCELDDVDHERSMFVGFNFYISFENCLHKSALEQLHYKRHGTPPEHLKCWEMYKIN